MLIGYVQSFLKIKYYKNVEKAKLPLNLDTLPFDRSVSYLALNLSLVLVKISDGIQIFCLSS